MCRIYEVIGKGLRLAAPSFDFVFLLLAQESPSELGSPFARSSVPTLGRASELSLLSLIGKVGCLLFGWLSRFSGGQVRE